MAADDTVLKAPPRRLSRFAISQVLKQQNETQHAGWRREDWIGAHQHRSSFAPRIFQLGLSPPRLTIANEGDQLAPRVFGIGEELSQLVNTDQSAALDRKQFAERRGVFKNPPMRVRNDYLLVRVPHLSKHLFELVLRHQNADCAKLHDDIGDACAYQPRRG
jgi:hypothetical protein